MSTVRNVEGARYLSDYLAEQEERKVNRDLGKNEFMMILVAQLQNQDPLNPASDTEFIAQLAQFSALEQMQGINTSTTMTQAYNLVGKIVLAEHFNPENGEKYELFGQVMGVKNAGGIPYLMLYNLEDKQVYDIPLGEVVEVYEPDLISSGENGEVTPQVDNDGDDTDKTDTQVRINV